MDEAARYRLLLLHYSGGGVSMYAEWPAWLPSDIGVQRVQLPGRQDRADELPFTELNPLLDALADVVDTGHDERPYALFGHSMGALLAYRFAVAQRGSGGRAPALLGVAGWAPVGFAEIGADPAARSDESIIDDVRGLGSMPSAALNDRELRTLLVPAMRADLAVCASHVDDGAVVGCPIAVYSGRDDPLVAPAAMRVWRDRTERYLGNRVFPGGHMFIHDHGLAIATDLAHLVHTHASVGAGVTE
ncbi:MAG TPA: alpha/beta fold hydrolase [Pseudonocardiaceae bacterium]|nr:alpha/beta fold hydrolase [Pseudonocardiaceae bacterium]